MDFRLNDAIRSSDCTLKVRMGQRFIASVWAASK